MKKGEWGTEVDKCDRESYYIGRVILGERYSDGNGFFFRRKTVYECTVGDWSSDVSLPICIFAAHPREPFRGGGNA